MRRFGFAIAMIALLVYPFTASAAQAPAPGTELTGTLQQTLDSAHAQVGERITLTNVASYDGTISGATVYGHVTNVVKPGQGRNAEIDLTYDTLVTKSTRYLLQARTKNVQVNTKSNAGKEAGGAAIGALVGGLIGHGAGAVIGGAGGYIAAKNNRSNVVIPAGSNVVMQVVSARRQASK
jgi:outer membrane lipoprotein SlyB